MVKEKDRTQEVFNYILQDCLPVIAGQIKREWAERKRSEPIEITRESIISWRLLTVSNLLYSSWSPPQPVPGTENAVRLFAHVQPIIAGIPVGASVQANLDLCEDREKRRIEITGWDDLIAAYDMITGRSCKTGDPIQPAVVSAEVREQGYQENLPKVRQLLRSWGYSRTELDMLIARLREKYPTMEVLEFEQKVIEETLKSKPPKKEGNPDGK